MRKIEEKEKTTHNPEISFCLNHLPYIQKNDCGILSHNLIEMKNRGERDNIGVKAFTLHLVDPSLIPSMTFGTLIKVRSDCYWALPYLAQFPSIFPPKNPYLLKKINYNLASSTLSNHPTQLATPMLHENNIHFNTGREYQNYLKNKKAQKITLPRHHYQSSGRWEKAYHLPQSFYHSNATSNYFYFLLHSYSLSRHRKQKFHMNRGLKSGLRHWEMA